MTVIICPRCKKERRMTSRGLCIGCYQHKDRHKKNCFMCRGHKFDYDKHMKDNPSNYKKRKKKKDKK